MLPCYHCRLNKNYMHGLFMIMIFTVYGFHLTLMLQEIVCQISGIFVNLQPISILLSESIKGRLEEKYLRNQSFVILIGGQRYDAG